MLKRKTKNIWMMPAEIPQNTIFMTSSPIVFFLREWPKLGLGNKVKQYFSSYDKDFCRMNYIRSEFDAEAEFLANKMIKNPIWTLKIIDQVEDWSSKFIKKAKKFSRLSFSKMKSGEMIKKWQEVMKLHILSHGVGASISWHADAEKERVTKAIWQDLSHHLEKIGSKFELAEIFSILTTPKEESYVAKEERDFLKIAIIISKKPKIRKIFQFNKKERLAEILQKSDKKIYQIIKNHHQKYCWLAYQYKGPATLLEEYPERLQEIFIAGDIPQKIYQNIIKERKHILLKQQHLFKQLKFTVYQRQLIKMAQRLVFIKDYRKDALYHGMYCYEPFFREIARRLGLTLGQIQAMNAWEIPEALLKNKFDVNELNARQKFAIAYADRKRYVVYTGQKARDFLKKITYEKFKIGKVKELKGTPACSGKVTGTVKVINVPLEMKKMGKGDIMVAHNTNPNLVPAMKKAAALISEAGGLTCHTAIVARELRTPCIVGVAGAAKVLKDGDRIEVDAFKGIVKKLN